MAFDIGTLRAYLTLDNSQYKKATDESIKTTGKLTDGLVDLNRGAIFAGAGITAIGAAAIAATNRAADFADAIKEAALITGMSTDEIQRWKYAADETGVSFDSLTGIMRMFTQNLRGVDDESGTLKKTLESLGITAKDNNGHFRDTNTLMLETLTALQKMDDPVRRNSLALQLYGRSWSELADFLEKDVKLASIMSRANPITKFQLDQAEAYKNKMGALNAQFDQITVRVGTKLIPAFSAITTFFSKQGVPAIEFFIDRVNRGLTNMAILSLRAFDIMNRAIGRTSNLEATFEESLAEQVRAENAAMSSGWSPGAVESTTFDNGNTSGGTSAFGDMSYSGSGGTGSGSSSSSGSTRSAIANTSTPSMLAAARAITAGITSGDMSRLAWGINQFKKATQINPYAQNDAYFGASQYAENGTDITGSATQGKAGSTPQGQLSWYTLFNKLQGMTGVSDSVRQMISKRKSEMENDDVAIANREIDRISSSPLSDDEYSMQYGTTKQEAIDLIRGRISSGVTHHSYESDNPSTLGREQVMMQEEWNRLTSGENAKYDSSGNAIIYVTIDGKTVAEAVVNKLALLGVKT